MTIPPALSARLLPPPAIPDYSYLLEEARLQVANRYFTPMLIQLLIGLVCVIASLTFRDSFLAIIGVAGLAACAISLHRDLGKRQRSIEIALAAARAKIEALIKEARETIEINRKAFEEAEEERIARIEKLLNGDPNAVFEKLEDVLNQFKLPFFLRCTVDIYGDPVITMHLPDQNIIPPKILTLLQSGNLDYEEKSPFQINKQYSEVLAGTAINIAITVFAFLPSINTLFIHGLFDKWQDEDYYFSIKFTRQQIIDVVACRSGFDAFHKLEAEFDVKTSGSFSPIQPVFPEWWDKVPKEKVKSLKVACKDIL